MIIDLNKLEHSPVEFDLVFEPGDIDLDTDFARIENEVKAAGTVTNENGIAVVDGLISASVELDCDRCLKSLNTESDFEFCTAYVPALGYSEDQEIELDIKQLEVSLLVGDHLDLKEVAREQILLSLPTHVVCRDDCKGLCELCGGNLNLKDCGCSDNQIDPRWAALKDLK